MNQQPRRKKNQSGYSGNHQRGWMWGHHAVTETLLSGTWPVNEIFVNQKAFDQCTDLLLAKQQAGIPVELVDNARLEQLTRSTEHQGLVARMGAFPYGLMKSLAAKIADSATQTAVPLVVICDRLQDAFNFGAILRCCDGANVLGVVVGELGQAEVTPHVARSSSGAVNHLSIIRVPDLIVAAMQLKQLGLQLVAADANTETKIWNAPLTGPTALVIGSEARGVQPELLAICGQRLWIPMHGKVSSLNAAVAAGILLYEIRRQQYSQ